MPKLMNWQAQPRGYRLTLHRFDKMVAERTPKSPACISPPPHKFEALAAH